VATVTYKGPLRPPVLAGQQVGKLNIFCADVLVQETPLYASATVEEGDLMRKSSDALKQLLLGWLP
jgi:D-alanyl-D-alanine carboxypeptidase (penicillin-binding protein 5/6)